MTDIGQGTKVSPPSVPGDDARRLLAEAEEALGMVARHPHAGFLMRANVGDLKDGKRFQDLPAVKRALGEGK